MARCISSCDACMSSCDACMSCIVTLAFQHPAAIEPVHRCESPSASEPPRGREPPVSLWKSARFTSSAWDSTSTSARRSAWFSGKARTSRPRISDTSGHGFTLHAKGTSVNMKIQAYTAWWAILHPLRSTGRHPVPPCLAGRVFAQWPSTPSGVGLGRRQPWQEHVAYVYRKPSMPPRGSSRPA